MVFVFCRYVKLPIIGLLMDINFSNKQTEINKHILTLLAVNTSQVKYKISMRYKYKHVFLSKSIEQIYLYY